MAIPEISEASPAPVVVFLGHSRQSWPALERRTAAELKLLGLSVLWEKIHLTSMAQTLRQLAKAASRHKAIAAITILRRARQANIQVWLQDRLTGKLTLRSIRGRADHSPDSIGKLALLVVEQLRASLIELRLPNAPHRPTAVPRAVAALVDHSLSRIPPPHGTNNSHKSNHLSIQTTLGMTASADHLHQAALNLSVSYALLPSMSISCALASTLAPQIVRDRAGTAFVGWLQTNFLLLFEPRPQWRIHPGVEFGLGIVWLWATGRPATGYGSNPVSALSLTTQMGLRIAIRITKSLDMVVHGAAILPATRIDVHLAGSHYGSTGHLLFDALGGVSLRL